MFNRKLKDEVETLREMVNTLLQATGALQRSINRMEHDIQNLKERERLKDLSNISKQVSSSQDIALKAKVEHLEEDIIRLEQYLDIKLKHTPESHVYVKRENTEKPC